MEKEIIIEKVENGFEKVSKLIETLSSSDFQKTINQSWTIKDVIAHLLWYEEEMVKLFVNKSLKTASSNWRDSFDERNQLIYTEMKDLAIEEILVRRKTAMNELIHILRDMDPKYLEDPSVFEDMPNTWVPWEILAQNTYDHYDDHLKKLTSHSSMR